MNNSKRDVWGAGVLAVTATLLGAVVFPIIIKSYFLTSTGRSAGQQDDPAILLPFLVIVGVVSLLSFLAFVTAIFSALNLSNTRFALGLPEGSVRAVIALSLILIFIITSVFLYEQLDDIPIRDSTGLTQEQLDLLPSDKIIALERIQPKDNESEPLFNATLSFEKPQVSNEFAQQVLTTVSTLVVAIAGFYFGTRSVQIAKGEVVQPTLRLLKPVSPSELGEDEDTALTIKLETDPPGMAIDGEIVEGDPQGKLEQTRFDEFVYKRGKGVEDLVVLNFSLSTDPDKPVELKITKPKKE